MNATTEPSDQTVPRPSLGKLIEERRHQLGLSKSAAARLAGINRGTWHEVEIGTRMNMLPDTLNQIEATLQWEPGTIYKFLNTPGDRDVIISQPDSTVTILEGRASRIEQTPASSVRHQIIATIAAMSDDDLPGVWAALRNSVVHASPDVAIQSQLDELRQMIEAMRQDDPQQDPQRPRSASQATPYLNPQIDQPVSDRLRPFVSNS